MVNILAIITGTVLLCLVILGIPALLIELLLPKVNTSPALPLEPIQTSIQLRQKSQIPQNNVLPFQEERKLRRRHVLDKYSEMLKGRVDTALASVVNHEGMIVRVAGVVIGFKEINSKTGLMATFVLEDPSGRAECIIYPMTYLAHPVKENQIIFVNAKVMNSKLLVNGLEVIGKRRKPYKKKEGIA